MSAAHTEGRAVVGILSDGLIGDHHCVSIEGASSAIALTGLVGESDDALSQANARRLAACWNTLVGMSTDDIEKLPAPFVDLLAGRFQVAIKDRANLERRIAAQREEINRLQAQREEAAKQLEVKTARLADQDEAVAAGYMKLQNNLAAARALLTEFRDEADAWIKECGATEVTDPNQILARVRAFLAGEGA